MNDEKNKRYCLLIVDDDEFLIKLYKKKAEQLDVELHIANDGTDALKMLQDGLVPDILLVDINMKEMTGLELLEKIRDDNMVPDAKIIILTNSDSKDAELEAQRLKADDYIFKIGQLASDVIIHALHKARSAEKE